MGNLTTTQRDQIEDTIRSLVQTITSELEQAAKRQVESHLSNEQHTLIELRKIIAGLEDRAIDAETAAQNLAIFAVTSPKGAQSSLATTWASKDFLPDPSQGLLGRAVESAVIACSHDGNAKDAWLRRRGWVLKTNNRWSDGEFGGAMGREEAVRLQLQRDLKPFDYMLHIR